MLSINIRQKEKRNVVKRAAVIKDFDGQIDFPMILQKVACHIKFAAPIRLSLVGATPFGQKLFDRLTFC